MNVDRCHKDELQSSGTRNIEAEHDEKFIEWFKQDVNKMHSCGEASNDLIQLAIGPNR